MNIKSLETVTFDQNSRLKEIREEAFEGTSLKKFDNFEHVTLVEKHAFPIGCDLGSVIVNRDIETKLGNPDPEEEELYIFDITQYEQCRGTLPKVQCNHGEDTTIYHLERWVKKGYWSDEVLVKNFAAFDEDQSHHSQKLWIREKDIHTAILSRKHPSIMDFLGLILFNAEVKYFRVVTEYPRGGTLSDILFYGSKLVNWNATVRAKTVVGIVKGMLFLHENDVMHRDLNPENIWFDSDARIRIAGLHTGCEISRSDTMTINVGTLAYMAPEVSDSEDGFYTAAVDVYSFGILLYEILTGKHAYNGTKNLVTHIINVKKGVRPEIPREMKPETANLIQSCWQTDPEMRPTFSDILKKLQEIGFLLEDGIDSSEVTAYLDWISSMETLEE